MTELAEQLLQIFGALLLLTGFALAQLGLLRQASLVYLLLNLAGSACSPSWLTSSSGGASSCSRASGR